MLSGKSLSGKGPTAALDLTGMNVVCRIYVSQVRGIAHRYKCFLWLSCSMALYYTTMRILYCTLRVSQLCYAVSGR